MGVTLILNKDHRWRVLETRVLKKIFKPKADTTGGWRNCIMRSFIHNFYS
jgi:hypothetical protein